MIWVFGIETLIALYVLKHTWSDKRDRQTNLVVIALLGAATIAAYGAGDFHLHRNPWND